MHLKHIFSPCLIMIVKFCSMKNQWNIAWCSVVYLNVYIVMSLHLSAWLIYVHTCSKLSQSAATICLCVWVCFVFGIGQIARWCSESSCRARCVTWHCVCVFGFVLFLESWWCSESSCRAGCVTWQCVCVFGFVLFLESWWCSKSSCRAGCVIWLVSYSTEITCSPNNTSYAGP